MEPKTIVTYDNREARKDYIIKMGAIAIELVDLVDKMTSTLTDFDSVLEVQKAINHLNMARTISYYNDKIEDEIDKENKYND